MQTDLELRRGAEARAVLESGMYKEAYTAIQDNIIRQLSLADTPDDKRKRLNDLLVALNKVKQYMEQVMISGQMAAQEIERKQTWAERMRSKIA